MKQDETILKKVPDSAQYLEIPGDFKRQSVKVNGYTYREGYPGVMFFPDGTREYSEIEIENIISGERYLVKLNPYGIFPEVSE
ncbi:MAG: hypothetical protein NC931_05885 [Candidatus Omnitrophica bacterium]|nr:hypothetical protein [Candidatus Omnitrophota bacterium]